jgi:acetyl-CoA C-acetyltransferase
MFAAGQSDWLGAWIVPTEVAVGSVSVELRSGEQAAAKAVEALPPIISVRSSFRILASQSISFCHQRASPLHDFCCSALSLVVIRKSFDVKSSALLETIMTHVYIASAARTPIGAFQGALASLTAPQLGAIAIKGALSRAGLAAELVSEVFMGNVLSAGVGQAPARQAMIHAGIPNTVPSTTVGKVCGSGLQAIILGARAILTGDADIVVAGGMESMSNVPYYLDKARTGFRMGNFTGIDGMIHDGLWDPYNNMHMGNCGDKCAAEYKFSREAQDEFAKDSYRKALSAQKEGLFDAEIEAVSVAQKKGEPVIVRHDEGPAKSDPNKISGLKPAFSKDGTVTAANASPINDGASALVLVSEAALKKHNITPLAKIAGHSAVAQDPVWFTTAPAKAIEKVTNKLGITTNDIDLYEINEAFAVVAMACAKLANVELSRVNVRGGAVALGHPIGASGARIVTTLLHAMKDQNKKRGCASICIGGGEALALVVERT